MTRFRLPTLAALLVATFAALPPPALGATKVICHGDSITLGDKVFDEQNRGGYPGRLKEKLRKRGVGDAVIVNAGVNGEDSFGGLSRTSFTLSQHPDAKQWISMYGTNDVNRVLNGLYSVESTLRNIDAMGQQVKGAGVEFFYATIIPRSPTASKDSGNSLTFSIVLDIRDLTASGDRQLAEPWDIFASKGDVIYREFYSPNPNDPVGHPNAAGFDLLAEHFADKLAGLDVLSPTPSGFTKTGNAKALKKGERLTNIMHESGAGINVDRTWFTINGRPVETTVEGNKRKIEQTYKVTADDIACAARITVRSEDLAEPPNVRNRLVGEYTVNGPRHIDGDVSGDCRVDGFDLALFGPGFGTLEGDTGYSKFADVDNNDMIDGDDLAVLTSNWGRNSAD
jgi:lysophospholipase L1-like esterase